MNQNKKLLICISNAYSCIDTIYNQLYLIKNNGFNIEVLFIQNKYNVLALNKLKILYSSKIIDSIFIVFESKNIIRYLYNKIVISKKYINQSSYILVGSSITPEEVIFFSCINLKKSIIYGVLTTTPPILMNQNFIETFKNQSIIKNKIIHFDKVSEYNYTETKELYLSKKIFYKIINAFFYRYKKYNKRFFRICLIFLTKNNNKFKIDSTAIYNQYLNKDFVRAHFTPNAYWNFILKLNYPNESIFQYSNINLSQFNHGVEKSDFIKNNRPTSLLIFGPISNLAFKFIIKAIQDITSISSIKLIKLRPHPRYMKCTEDLLLEINIHFPLIITNKLTLDESIQSQSENIDFVLTPLTSALNSIFDPNQTFILLHKEWTILEFGVHNIEIITGWAYGYNSQWLEINYNGEINQYLNNLNKSKSNIENFGKTLLNVLKN